MKRRLHFYKTLTVLTALAGSSLIATEAQAQDHNPRTTPYDLVRVDPSSPTGFSAGTDGVIDTVCEDGAGGPGTGACDMGLNGRAVSRSYGGVDEARTVAGHIGDTAEMRGARMEQWRALQAAGNMDAARALFAGEIQAGIKANILVRAASAPEDTSRPLLTRDRSGEAGVRQTVRCPTPRCS